MFNPSRDQARDFLFNTWAKHRQGLMLTDLEKTALGVIARHTEYHALLETPEQHRPRDYAPEFGVVNPFLHLSMHLALEEQISIDQPAGVLRCYQALCHKMGDAHHAQHEMMDCLAEMLWQSQRTGTAPDGTAYIRCMEQKASVLTNV